MTKQPNLIAADTTLMHCEAASASEVVAHQYISNRTVITQAVATLKALNPQVIVTLARGSSDHAATYAKYMFESALGIITSSASPSVSSVYNRRQNLKGVMYLAISQSGASPDLLHNVDEAKKAGATVVALVNVEKSPLAEKADILIPLHAGEEKSVAATKTYIATLSAILDLAASWSAHPELEKARDNLPQQLANAWQLDWSKALPTFEHARNFYVIGRGLGLGIAQEAALKFKETCGLHAEAFSAAEVKHGPMAIVDQHFPVLVFTQNDETLDGIEALTVDFLSRGCDLFAAMDGKEAAWKLPVVERAHPAIAPILTIQSFYKWVNALAVARGYNPDEPPHLNKVTCTM